LRVVISNLEEKVEIKEQEKIRKEAVPNKYKKISMAFPRKATDVASNLAQRIPRLKLDLKCL